MSAADRSAPRGPPARAADGDAGGREIARLRDALRRAEQAGRRLGGERDRARRDAERSRAVTRLTRDANRIADRDAAADAPADGLGVALLAAIAGASGATHAAILQADRLRPGPFAVTHGIGVGAGQEVRLASPSRFLFDPGGPGGPGGADGDPAGGPDASCLAALVGGGSFLWAHDPESGRALALGRAGGAPAVAGFEAADREIVDAALFAYGDVLLRKRSEITLRAAKRAAEDASSAQARFLATLSHELRTPLNSVIGFSELLLEARSWMRRPEQQNEFLREILDSGRTLLSLINEILDFSSFGHAAPKLQPGWVAVDRLLHDARLGLRDAIARSGVAVAIATVTPGAEIRVDYDRFRRILANIVGNALKFTPAGGAVAIGFELTIGGSAGLTIADTGIGMHRDDIARSLEPFVQLDDGAARRYGGSGLGLPIARQLIEAHGGELVIDSRFGAGTRVTILLPEGSARACGTASEDTA